MKIYLASKYTRYPEMQGYRAILEQHGHVVTSRWINGNHEHTDVNADAERSRFAEEDMDDLAEADVVLWFSEPEKIEGRNRGGRHVEFGAALAFGMPIVVIGRKENVFHYLPEVVHRDNLQEAIEYLEVESNEMF